MHPRCWCTAYARATYDNGINRLHTASQVGGIKRMESKGPQLSGLARIDQVLDHPVDLFRIWHDEFRRFNPSAPDACCLATVSKDCKVSARNVVLREFDNDGFVIVTDSRSKKVANVENVPHVAMCYLWFHVNEKEQWITKQVRVEGTMKRLEAKDFQHLYDREPLYCKIRSHLCHQGREVSWEDLKQRHDEILESVGRNETGLRMPDHFIAYKLLPTMMEFYFARDQLIGDRIMYQRDTLEDLWEHHRIAA
ncbi:pyridoxine/pyridoxamine 5'-phosphate oxidase isoform X2 [Andrena cerasifolii]|uniref:pyridoxine/pyridoxamine 5'-phosphate oxidase isoform X2 n=1 Tax=Andrena cerasifolii TaxID=2819439 RepID=UPI0040379C2C